MLSTAFTAHIWATSNLKTYLYLILKPLQRTGGCQYWASHWSAPPIITTSKHSATWQGPLPHFIQVPVRNAGSDIPANVPCNPLQEQGCKEKKTVIITPQKPSWPPSPHLLSLGALNSSQDKLFYPQRTSSGLQWGNNKLAQESMERPPPHQGPYDLWNLRTCLQKRLYRCFLWGHLQWDNVGVREAYPGYPFRVCRTREAWMCHQGMASSHLFWAKIDCLS